MVDDVNEEPRDRVTIVTVTYGDRWEELSWVITSVLDHPRADLIVVLNGVSDRVIVGVEELLDSRSRIEVIAVDANEGSAPAFARALSRAYRRHTPILILDDDNPLQRDTIDRLESIETALRTRGETAFALAAYRPVNPVHREMVAGRAVAPLFRENVPGAFQNVEVWSAMRDAFDIRRGRAVKDPYRRLDVSTPRGSEVLVELPSAMWGGLYLPLSVTAARPLHNPDLILYGDDNDFTRVLHELGVVIFLCAGVAIFDTVDWRTPLRDTSRRIRIPRVFSTPPQETWRILYQQRNWSYLSTLPTRGRLARRLRLIVNATAKLSMMTVAGLVARRPRLTVQLLLACYAGFRGRLGRTYPLPGGKSSLGSDGNAEADASSSRQGAPPVS